MSRVAICACLALAGSLVVGTAGADDGAAPAPAPEGEKLGYAIGRQVGGDFRRLERELDVEALRAGLRDALAGAEPRWSPAAMREALRALEQARASAAPAEEPPSGGPQPAP
jgi:hypothetical protein